MKILVFTHLFPWPLNEGGRVAQYGILEKLSKVNEVIVVFPEKNTNDKDVASLKERIPNLKLRSFRDKTTKPKFNIFQKVIRKVIWKLRPLLPKEIKGILENDFFLNPIRPRSEFQLLEIRKICVEEKPDILQVDFIDNADIGLICPENIKKVLVIHDIRFESVQRAAHQERLTDEYTNYLSETVKLKEIPFLDKFQGIITFSKENATLLSKEKIENVFVSPFSIDSKYFREERQSAKISKLVFLGPDHHSPNLKALEWFAQNVSQDLFNKFGMKTSVIGNWEEKNISKFQKYISIEFLGYVSDLTQSLSGTVLIVPLQIGSGIRTKILEAFAMKVPVISSKIGIEGIGAKEGVHFLLAEDREAYLNAMNVLIYDLEFVKKMTDNAQDFVRKNFSSQIVYERRMEIFNSILKNPIGA